MSKYLALIAAASVLLAMPPARSQQADYPNRPIKIVVCLPAGGGVDTVTRMVSDKLQRRLGQPIIIENKGGQAGNLGAEVVWSAEPDGYTLLASQPAPITTNPMLYKNLGLTECQAGRFEDGEKDLRLALKDLPGDPEIAKALEILTGLRATPR